MKDTLLAFRARVEEAWLAGEIRAPVHFPGGNEDQLLEVYRDVRPEDWVLGTWRSMYHALLKGVPEEMVFRQMREGRSMYLSSKEHRFLCSAIVGGTLPIAAGLAMGIKRRGGSEKVWAFVGDMTAETGLYDETLRYATGHRLPLKFVVEDNGLSTNTPTQSTWGSYWFCAGNIRRYVYERTRPHVGLEKRVTF